MFEGGRAIYTLAQYLGPVAQELTLAACGIALAAYGLLQEWRWRKHLDALHRNLEDRRP